MFIKRIDKKNKSILVAIPLTTTSGKIRVKERDNIYGYGLPFASRTKKFNLKNYIEWQIGYDIEITSDKIDLTTLKEVNFVAYNKKKKALYELSEYLYHLAQFGIVSTSKLKELKKFVKNLKETDLISKHPHCSIKRTHPNNEKINNLNFEILTIQYPQLIHKFKNYEVIAEITIREKQKAIGVQPMLYFCF
ncbi:MAG TPA: R.Pab1 family restriction endonuclease, partial [Spirochaetota bacterium]|nr:R.Pab1 family restriction endonuclease [Spirochaetota bacterium]